MYNLQRIVLAAKNESRTVNPTFSIIIPCHNDAVELQGSIESVVCQDFEDWQLVVVDDGSTDDTPAVAAKWAEHLGDRLSFRSQTNSGVSSARNHGIEAAQGRFLIFLDADDALQPGALSIYKSALDGAAATGLEVDWIIGGHQLIRGDQTKIRCVELPNSRGARFRDYLDRKFSVGNISSMCFAASLFVSLKFPETLRVGEDTVVFALLFSKTDPMAIDEVTAIVNRRTSSLRTQLSYEQLVQSPITDAIFEHEQLAAEFVNFRAAFVARRALSLARRAYHQQDFAGVDRWSKQAVEGDWRSAFNFKFLYRWLRASLANR